MTESELLTALLIETARRDQEKQRIRDLIIRLYDFEPPGTPHGQATRWYCKRGPFHDLIAYELGVSRSDVLIMKMKEQLRALGVREIMSYGKAYYRGIRRKDD